jgi:hypothetical protein
MNDIEEREAFIAKVREYREFRDVFHEKDVKFSEELQEWKKKLTAQQEKDVQGRKMQETLKGYAEQRMRLFPLKIEEHAFKMIAKTFQHQIRCQTRVVFDPQKEKVVFPGKISSRVGGGKLPKIVVGKFGLGLRFNKQSTIVTDDNEFRYVLAQGEQICANLRAMRLGNYADAIEQLLKVMPDYRVVIDGGLVVQLSGANSFTFFNDSGYECAAFGISAQGTWQSLNIMGESVVGTTKHIIHQGADMRHSPYQYAIYKKHLEPIVPWLQQEFQKELDELKRLCGEEKTKPGQMANPDESLLLQNLRAALDRWLLLASL